MPLKKYSWWFTMSILAVFLSGCSAPKRVAFSNPVDTKSKPVTYPEKQTFGIPELGVYATNNFDGARLNDVEKINDSTVNVVIRPENTPINNSAYYAFKIWADTPRTLYVQFDYPSDYSHRYWPKLSTSGKHWITADTTDIFLKDAMVTLKMKLSKDTTWVAAQELFTSTDVKTWYSGLEKKYGTWLHTTTIGHSKLGKNIPLLDLYSGNPKGKAIVVLLTRQHPPEVTGHMAFLHFLETILGSTSLSETFFEKFRILAFPIMNPDGVDMGNWRHNAGGVDLNRDWSYYRQPEVRRVAKAIESIVKKDKGTLLLGIDFHSTRYDIFYTSTQRQGTTLPDFIPQWFAGLEANIPDYKVNEDSSSSNRPVSMGWFLKRFNAVGITYEVGDATPRDFIALKAKVAATEMMKLLLTMYN